MTFSARGRRVGAIALSMGLILGTGCKPSAPVGSSTPSPTPPALVPPSPTPPTPSVTPAATTLVTIYKADEQCINYLPEEIAVPDDRPMEAAVGKILADFNSPGLDLAGYRVVVDGTVATVDFRLSPQTERGISSLSACEQFALFGSLHETLTQHPDWGIQTVKFTERGAAIAL